MLAARIKEKAYALGFDLVGIAPAMPAESISAYIAWVDQGYAGEMRYLTRPDRIERRRRPSLIVPHVKSVVVVGKNYFTQQLPAHVLRDPSRGMIASYAWDVDYHDVMTPRLCELQAFIEAQVGGAVSARAYVDTGPILERAWAVRAGLGFFGKNTMLIHPRWGSWLFLGEILLDVELAYDERDARGTCGLCTRCMDACPTNAFPEPYVLDARRCISYLTIELKGPIPPALRPLIGNRIFGCDICNDVCPWNKRFARPIDEQGRRGPLSSLGSADKEMVLPFRIDRVAPKLLDLIALDDGAFRERFRQSPIRRAKRRGLLRNVAVALGNWGDPVVVPALAEALHDHEPLIRGHAAWALGQIDAAQVRPILQQALTTEEDAYVRGEIRSALFDT